MASILEGVTTERDRLSALVADGAVCGTPARGGSRNPKCASQGSDENKSSGRGERPEPDKGNETFFHGGSDVCVGA
jgi:hypothetical protein